MTGHVRTIHTAPEQGAPMERLEDVRAVAEQGLEIMFQPRTLFENMGVTGDTEAGQHDRDVIQDRLESYDSVCPHADLGDWGVDTDREWPQYLFSEDEAQAPSTCPITITRDHPKPAARLP